MRKVKLILTIMTDVLQLNSDIYTSLGIISRDEALLRRVSNYLKKIAAKKKEQDETLMTKEEFFNKLELSRQQIQRGEGITFTNKEDMHNWLNSL